MGVMKFTAAHEWIRVDDDNVATVGITDYAQEQLGDVVFVELPAAGAEIGKGDLSATIESVKSVGEIHSAVSGTVAAVNERLADEPTLVNEAPLGDGWFYTLRLVDPGELDGLMDEAAYQAHIDTLD